MTAWVCPDCNGGFPAPADGDGGASCPWCSRKLPGFDDVELPAVISRTEKRDPDAGGGQDGDRDGLFERLLLSHPEDDRL